MAQSKPLLLLTAFEPFDDTGMNSSEQALAAVKKCGVAGVKLACRVLPVDQQKAPAALIAAVDRLRPDAVVCLGQSARRTAISIERIAINLLDFRKPDNAGRKFTDRPIVRAGPAAYFTTLPVRAMWSAVRRAKVPVELSQDAGSYLCNQVTYALLHHAAMQRRKLPAGFIHLPSLPEQALHWGGAHASMSVASLAIGVTATLTAISKHLRSKRSRS